MLNWSAWGECVSLKTQDIELKWSAFKTPFRQEVSGQFKDLKLRKKGSDLELVKAQDLHTLLEDLEVEIKTSSLTTGIAQRDQHIKEYFFKDMLIKARLGKASDKEVHADILMNQKLSHTRLQLKVNKNKVEALGYIDILDFQMSDALAALTKQCFALHEGKTWSDVRLEITAQTKGCTL